MNIYYSAAHLDDVLVAFSSTFLLLEYQKKSCANYLNSLSCGTNVGTKLGGS